MKVLSVKGLSKRFKDVLAVDNVNFEVDKGEVFGLLGPNGAGKTTTLEMIEMIQKVDAGEVEILGMNTKIQAQEIKKRIGIQLQATSLYDKIKVKECIDLFASYYPSALDTHTLLDWVSLQEKKNSYTKTLSGGQKQRLVIALCLVNNPELVFLDEPTTGLDPQARRNIWDIIERLQKEGKTVILTTHYMDEAERLCNRLAIMDKGKIIALGTPNHLIQEAHLPTTLSFYSPNPLPIVAEEAATLQITYEKNQYVLKTLHSNQTLQYLLKFSEIDINYLTIQKPTLEDLFIHLTGKTLRD